MTEAEVPAGQLGNTSITIPPVVVGTWAWGKGPNGGNEIFGDTHLLDDLRPVFNAAIEQGYNFVDTAAVYGMGASEKIIGKLNNEERQDRPVLLASKFTPMRIITGKNSPRKWLKKTCKRLGVDTLDLYQIHLPYGMENWLNVLADLFEEGKIRAIGVSNFDLDQTKRAADLLARRGVCLSSVQNHFSLLWRQYETSGLIKWCLDNHVTFLSYMVLEQGVLSGKFTQENLPPLASRRGKTYTVDVVGAVQPLIRSLGEVGSQAGGMSPAETAISWAISKGTVPIIGATKESHIASLSRATANPLSQDLVENLDDVAASTGLNQRVSWEPDT